MVGSAGPACRALCSRAMRRLVVVLLAALAAGAGGCGATDSSPEGGDATLLLDFAPNAVHAGIYSAVARGYDDGEGVKLRVRVPGATSDAVKLLLADRTDFAVLDIHDLALARERGHDLVGIMALVQRPLAAVLAQPRVRAPRQLAGQTVGVTGVPSDTAVLRSIVAGDGGDPRRLKPVNIGFNAVPALLGRRVAGATAFWSAEGVALHRRRPGIRTFRVDDYGAPGYPELVVCATRATLRERPELARAVVRALLRGYRLTLDDPASSAQDELARAPDLDRPLLTAELDAVSPVFQAADGHVGELDLGRLQAWARWEARFGIVRRPPDVARMFDPSFVGSTER